MAHDPRVDALARCLSYVPEELAALTILVRFFSAEIEARLDAEGDEEYVQEARKALETLRGY